VKGNVKTRYRLIRRGNRGGAFYCVDSETGKRSSLGAVTEDEACQIVEAKNTARRQPQLNLHIARAYLAGTDSGIATRTWQDALNFIIESKLGSTQRRWRCAAKDNALDGIRHRVIVETQAEHLLACLKAGTVSTNVHLRMLHNFCLSMNWLAWPLIAKRLWPAVRFKEKRAITVEEHARIVAREQNPERRAFYQLAWYLGASQADLAGLESKNVDWEQRVISFARQKTGSIALLRFGDEVANILRALPATGPLFPYMSSVRSGDRSTEFKQRCDGLGIKGVTLHSYRYAWAERAKVAGYPERFAQESLGHNSKAVHRAYARKAQVLLPALEDYERDQRGKVVPFAPLMTVPAPRLLSEQR
jgi:integrase